MSATETISPPGAPRLLGGSAATAARSRSPRISARYGALPLELRAEELRERVADVGAHRPRRRGVPDGDEARVGARRQGTSAVVVANGDGGRAAVGKDKALLAYAPHLVVDGAILAARAVGAKRCDPRNDRRRAPRPSRVRSRNGRGARGRRSETAVVPERFVAGEETALVQFLNGGPALPTFTPPRPVRARRRRRADGGLQRRDARAPRARRALRRRVVPLGRNARRARIGTRDGLWRRRQARRLRGRARQPVRVARSTTRGPTPMRRRTSSAATSAPGSARQDVAGAVLSNAGLARVRRLARRAARSSSFPRRACGIVETARVARYLAGRERGPVRPVRARPRGGRRQPRGARPARPAHA